MKKKLLGVVVGLAGIAALVTSATASAHVDASACQRITRRRNRSDTATVTAAIIATTAGASTNGASMSGIGKCAVSITTGKA